MNKPKGISTNHNPYVHIKNATSGITLIALVVTIIVLLILAGVSIAMLTGENGILTRAQGAVEKYREAEEKEIADLDSIADFMDNYGKKDNNNIHSVVIPEGGKYIAGLVFDQDEFTWDETNKVTYNPGDSFPETVNVGDRYIYGDYEYCYNCSFGGEWILNEMIEAENEGIIISDGWGVSVIDREKENYGEIIENINLKNVTTMYSTFAYNTSLTTPPKIPSTIKSMVGTFAGCTSITDLSDYVIPSSVEVLYATFSGTSITNDGFPIIQEGIKRLGATFTECLNITDVSKLVIPNSVTELYATFSRCSNVTTAKGLKIPSNVKIMNATFFNCTSLTSEGLPTIPRGVEVLDRTFADCTSITSLSNFTIPSTVTNLNGTFEKCTSLNNISELVIPDSVTDMSNTFFECTSLEDASDLKISENVTTLSFTFSGCTKLEKIPSVSHCSKLTNMHCTFQSCPITDLGTYRIPQAVINMEWTFAHSDYPTGTVEIPCCAENVNNYVNQTIYHIDGCTGECGK